MVWECFSGQGMGLFHIIKDTMTGIGYRTILNDVIYPYAEENIPLVWRFQHDNDPNHTFTVVSEWLQSNVVRLMKWTAQSPDLNPIENLYKIVDRKITTQNYTRRKIYRRRSLGNSNISKQTIKRYIPIR